MKILSALNGLNVFKGAENDTVDSVIQSFSTYVTKLQGICTKKTEEVESISGKIEELMFKSDKAADEARKADQISKNLSKLIHAD